MLPREAEVKARDQKTKAVFALQARLVAKGYVQQYEIDFWDETSIGCRYCVIKR